MTAIVDAGQVVASIGARILGRTALDDIDNPITGENIVKAGTMILEADVVEIEKCGIQSVRIRSALTCEIQTAFAASATVATLHAVPPSTWVKPWALSRPSRSVKPGTQLPMRTFHLGGTGNGG